MTVTWHVDNLKISYMKQTELKKSGQYLRDNLGDALTEHTGNIPDYLGIDLNFLTKGEFKVSKIKYQGETTTNDTADGTTKTNDRFRVCVADYLAAQTNVASLIDKRTWLVSMIAWYIMVF